MTDHENDLLFRRDLERAWAEWEAEQDLRWDSVDDIHYERMCSEFCGICLTRHHPDGPCQRDDLDLFLDERLADPEFNVEYRLAQQRARNARDPYRPDRIDPAYLLACLIAVVVIGGWGLLCGIVFDQQAHPNGSTDGRFHTCGYVTEQGVTDHLGDYNVRCRGIDQ